MWPEYLAYLMIAAAAILAGRHIWRQTRPGADPACGCGPCAGCAESGCAGRTGAPLFDRPAPLPRAVSSQTAQEP